MKKVKYEKPTSLDAGQVAAIQGANCSNGNVPYQGACINGFDPAIQPVCSPSGLNSSGNCKNGSSAQEGCSTGSAATWGCFVGNTP